MEANKKQASFFKFEDLRLYDKAVEYNKWLVATFRTKQISKAEDILVDDFVRASLTVAKCIAEGAYYSKKEFELYLKDAKTNVRECYVLTEISSKLELLTIEETEKSKDCLMELTRMLGALIVSLNKRTSNKKDSITNNSDKATTTNIVESTEENYEFNLEF
ncbi:MAG: four helix bundle protein [Bacteroidales bacterium]|nr:four helix bundle protein [Bacteroidales bacterium]